ncbi:MAG: T9SS type A sorting domain-containing protein [Flavobacteriales bacterium]|nr:T9SS type A sorting domain-containing protein [Flavobacteriales bacterium]
MDRARSVTPSIDQWAALHGWADPGTGPRWAGTANCQSATPLPSDCVGGAAICNAQQISANPNNTGLTQDLNQLSRGCLGSNERQGYWYRFTVSGTGLLGFTISPNNAGDDYDFGIWGPYSSITCPPRETPVRCNYSGDPGDTGLSALGSNPTEGGSGNKWSSRLPVIAGENYFLYVSNFSQSGLAFDLSWQLESGASLDCTLLPIQLLSLNGAPVPEGIRLDWSTATESNSAAFAIERMNEFGDFVQIGELPAAGNSNSLIEYQFIDSQPMQGFNHFRLKMIDADGSAELSQVVSVANRYGGFVGLYPNPATDHISIVMDELPESEIIIRFHDASGRLVREERTMVAEGQSLVTIPLLGLDPGHYALSYSFQNSAMRYGGRFLVQ